LDWGDQRARAEAELVVVALPGVQRFIAEARSTADVSAASGIYSKLAQKIVESLDAEPGGDLVLPAAAPEESVESGTPNRVVVLLPAGTGADAASRATAAANTAWRSWIREIWRLPGTAPVPETPGFPVLHWVCVPARPGGYAEQWREAQRLLAARRRVRDFAAVPEEQWRDRALCSLTPRWPAERTVPPGPDHDKELKLSTVGWVKHGWRRLHNLDGFPSTTSIASAPYRAAVLGRLGDPDVQSTVAKLAAAEHQIRNTLKTRGHETPVPGLPVPDRDPGRWLAVDGGPWVYPDRWRPETLAREATVNRAAQQDLVRAITAAVSEGREAARHLQKITGQPLASYLAVVVQDLDNMGSFLGGMPAVNKAGREIKIPVIPNEHGRLSRELLSVAEGQRKALESAELLGKAVYAGGDDLLAFTPAARALDAAMRCHDLVSEPLPHASTAVLFFHNHASIQQAMREARGLLEKAKDRINGKHGLAVGYLRRSGVSDVSIQPWSGYAKRNSAELFGLFRRDAEHRLSPRLVADLDRDVAELSSLVGVPGGIYQQEIARLVRRHINGTRDGHGLDAAVKGIAEALVHLGEHERSPEEPGAKAAVRPQAAARVGVFLRQEAR
jgi:CRISPR-associated protein Cmr2